VLGDPHGASIETATYQYDARHEMRGNGSKAYTYDSSGNRLTTRSGGVLDDSLLYTTGSNRLWKSFQSTGALDKTFEHDGNGSRHIEVPPCPTCDWRLYYYNSLGQQTGHKFYSGQWLGGPQKCIYDPVGRRVRACDDGSIGGWAGFDGDNVIRLVGGVDWRFVHGPGLDDPLVGMYFVGGGNPYRKHYYLTDGRGRHLAFTDSVGTNFEGDVTYFQNGGNQAGSIGNSNGFANTRAESPSAPALSFYRNRYYDQKTGRFTQEDPIGIAGGANLYAYSGNNPATFTDPFGLCPRNASALATFACHSIRATTTILGTVIGFVGGGGGGLLASAPTAGVAAPVTVPAGAVAGAAGGGLLGAAAGDLITNALFKEGGQGGSGGRGRAGRDETANFNNAVRELGLDKNQASDALHAIKKAAGLGGRDNVIFNTRTGDVLNKAREVIGNLRDVP
jgi:RHS repeat-associated protein